MMYMHRQVNTGPYTQELRKVWRDITSFSISYFVTYYKEPDRKINALVYDNIVL